MKGLIIGLMVSAAMWVLGAIIATAIMVTGW
jgi:hypothetical protein